MMRQARIFYVMAVLLIVGIAACQQSGDKPETASGGSPVEVSRASIACTRSAFFCYTVYVAMDKGYFKERGVEIDLKNSYPHVRASQEALMKKEADFVVSSETAFMHAVLRGDPITAVASMISADNHLAVVARKDSGIEAGMDLKGKNIAVQTGSNAEYFLDIVLSMHGLSQDMIVIHDLKPAEMLQPLLDKKVDAIVLWNPYMRQYADALGENATLFFADRLYSPTFLISSHYDFINDYPDRVEQVVQALIDASEFIRNNRDEADVIAARFMDGNASAFANLSSTYFFRITLDQSLLLILDHQAQWAVERNITKQKQIPNFLDHLYTDALKRTKPQNMTLIQ